MAAWLTLMEEEIIPLQVAKGMVIPGSFRGETDDSVYVWLRRFESEAEREQARGLSSIANIGAMADETRLRVTDWRQRSEHGHGTQSQPSRSDCGRSRSGASGRRRGY